MLHAQMFDIVLSMIQNILNNSCPYNGTHTSVPVQGHRGYNETQHLENMRFEHEVFVQGICLLFKKTIVITDALTQDSRFPLSLSLSFSLHEIFN